MQKLFDYGNCDLFELDFILKNGDKLTDLSNILTRCWTNTSYNEMVIEFSTFMSCPTPNNLISSVELSESEINKIENKLISINDIIVKEIDRKGNIIKSYRFENKLSLIRLDVTKYYLSFELSR